MAGFVFRAMLGAALIGGGWDTYMTTWQRVVARADRDITATGAIRRHARKLAEQDAKHQLDFEYDQPGKDRQLQQMITDEKRNLRQEQPQMAAQLEHNGVLKEINLTAQSHSERMIFQAGNATPRLPSGRPVRRNHKRMKRDLRLELGRIILSKNLEMTGPKFVERLGAELGVQFGARAKISKNTAYADFAALRANQRELVGQDNVKPLIES